MNAGSNTTRQLRDATMHSTTAILELISMNINIKGIKVS
jgi:hypothetical protein